MKFETPLSQALFKTLKIYPKKRVNRNISKLKYYIFDAFIHLIGIIFQFSYVYAHFTHYQWVKQGLILPELNHITSIGPTTHPQSELLPD